MVGEMVDHEMRLDEMTRNNTKKNIEGGDSS